VSALTDAFSDLYEAQTEVCGEEIQATVGAVTADAVVGEARFDQILAAGGTAENGGRTLQMRKSDFITPPVKLAAVVIQDQTLSLLDFRESHGTYLMVCGDPVANE
jgi:hypothetical protein